MLAKITAINDLHSPPVIVAKTLPGNIDGGLLMAQKHIKASEENLNTALTLTANASQVPLPLKDSILLISQMNLNQSERKSHKAEQVLSRWL